MSQAMMSRNTELINRMFVQTSAQLDIVCRRNRERGWDFRKKDFAARGEPPAWPSDRLSAVVLDVSLDTVEKTFDEAWRCAMSVQKNDWRSDKIGYDAGHVRLLPGITHKRGLRWRVIDLGANWNRRTGISPADVRNAKTSPHSAILWAASYFPKWVREMDGVTVPHVWIPGYQLNVASSDDWSETPCLYWCHSKSSVGLLTIDANDESTWWAVPEFRA